MHVFVLCGDLGINGLTYRAPPLDRIDGDNHRRDYSEHFLSQDPLLRAMLWATRCRVTLVVYGSRAVGCIFFNHRKSILSTSETLKQVLRSNRNPAAHHKIMPQEPKNKHPHPIPRRINKARKAKPAALLCLDP